MNSERSLRFLTGILLAIATTLVFASSANAQGKTFSMVGEWALNRGILVDIPINGGPVLCFAGDNALIPGAAPGADHGGCVGRGAVLPSLAAARIPWPRTAAANVVGFRPANGGVPGAAAITTVGTKGSFTVPPGAFFQPSTGIKSATVMLAPTVVQLQTTISALGPPSFTQATMATAGLGVPGSGAFPIQQPAKFMADAWSKDAGQAGPGLPAAQIRPGASFTWCPTNPNCVFGIPVPGPGGPFAGQGTPVGTTIGNNAGPVDGVIRYTPGVNKFGGTMAMLLGGGGSTSVKVGSVIVPPPGTTMTLNGGPGLGRTMIPLLAHLPFGGGAVAFVEPQVNGAGFAFTNTISLASAPLHMDFKTSMSVAGVTSGGGMITASGPTGFGNAPADHNTNFGFPWTTGAVSIMNVELSVGGGPGSGTLTANGHDDRTPGGNGAITLVAGGTANRTFSTDDFEALEVVTMVFNDGLNTPSMGPAGLATVALLMALTAGFTLRKRFASAA